MEKDPYPARTELKIKNMTSYVRNNVILLTFRYIILKTYLSKTLFLENSYYSIKTPKYCYNRNILNMFGDIFEFWRKLDLEVALLLFWKGKSRIPSWYLLLKIQKFL